MRNRSSSHVNPYFYSHNYGRKEAYESGQVLNIFDIYTAHMGELCNLLISDSRHVKKTIRSLGDWKECFREWAMQQPAKSYPGLVWWRNAPPRDHCFDRRVEKRGLAPKATLGLSMRKLVSLTYGVVKSGQSFPAGIPVAELEVQEGNGPSVLEISCSATSR